MIDNQPASPLFRPISLALPAVALVIGFMVLSGSRNGDVARALGGGVLITFSLEMEKVPGVVSALGVALRLLQPRTAECRSRAGLKAPTVNRGQTLRAHCGCVTR